MRRIVLALAGTLSALVMLFSYHTSLGAPAISSGARIVATGPVGGPGAGGGASGSAGGAPSPRTVIVDGATARTDWGPVQVRVTVAGGRIVDVDVLQYPTGNGHDEVVNSYALPILRHEALAAQSARIDHVSGATITSDGYRTSLQSALDQVHL